MNKISILKRIIAFIILFGTVVSFGAVFTINNVSVNEGNSGTRTLDFTVSVNGPCQKNVTYYVDYATSNGTASAGSDYVSRTGTVNYSRSNTRSSGLCGTRTVSITINGDTTYEPNETFTVTLSNARSSNASYPASISDATGIGTINNDDSEIVVSAFNLRYKKNIKGNMKTIGNTVLARKDSSGNYLSGTSSTNAGDQLRYVDTDSDSSTFNSSLAVLEDSAILTPTAAKVKWAGLYWTGYLHTYDENDIDGSDEVSVMANTNYKTLTDFASIDNVIKNHTIKFKIGSTSYDIGSHTVLGEIQYTGSSSYTGWSYGCFAEVTNLMLDSDPRGTYSVANIPSMEGATNRGNYNDSLGNSGAWTLVVIYENNSVGEKTRNATVFDGFVKITSSDDAIIDVVGFKTPKSGNVDSTLSVFASEGDKYYTGDQFIFKNIDGDKAGQSATLSSSDGSSNYFNSSITGVDNRTPSVANNNGIDIHTDQVGTSGYNIVSTNQTKAQITLTSSSDVYYPVMVGFATELYMPKLCYDYSALLNGELMQKDASDRTFIPHKNDGILQSKVFIRSLEGDFPYLKSSLKSSWSDITTPPSSIPPVISFSDALVQNPDVYAYEEPEYIDEAAGEYYIGTDKSGSGGQKGTIEPYKSLYAISNFNTDKLYGTQLQLNVNVKASLALDETDLDSLTYYEFSTSDGTLEICPGTLTYNPMWYQFNVEKYDSAPGDYALSTQVTGTDYNLQIVAYTKDSSDNYTTRTAFTGALEIEPFEIPSFQSLGSYDENKYNFDRICEDSSNGKAWYNGQRHFSKFENSERIPLGITADDNRYAMRNVGIRMWVLVADYNGDGKLDDVAQNNNCENTAGTCFKSLYANDPYYKTVDMCDTQCGSSSTDETCYQCLRKYYSQPICSRDNFSVRPYGVELTAKSKAALIQKNDTVSSLIHNLISGVLDDYIVDMVAKSPSGQADPNGYYFRRLSSDARDIVNNLFDTLTEFFGLKFDNALVNNSGDISNCADSSHKRFDAGTSGWKLENDNVGNYDVVLIDKDWTLVDQARYPYKASVSVGKDDCVINSTILNSTGFQGCDVQSFEVNSDSKYNEITVKYVPANIDIQGIAYGSTPAHGTKWAYMNNLDKVDSDYNMAAQFAGNIAAKNAKGDTVSNFTAGCMAQNVNLFTQYTTTQLDGKDIKPENMDGTILQGGDSTPSIHYAQKFNDGSFSSATPVVTKSTADTTDGTNYDDVIQTQVANANFLDAGLGSLAYDLRYNINKLYYAAVRPIEILFVKLSSELIGSDNLQVTAWKDGVNTNKIGEKKEYFTGGVTDIANNSFKFLYGRVYTNLEKYHANGKPVQQDSISTKFNALVYSNAAPSGILVSNGVLDTTAVDTSWYLVKGHSVDSSDGQIDLLKVISQEKGTPSITPSADIKFNSAITPTGITPNVEIKYSRPAERSNKVVVQINPTIWLRYNKDRDKNGLPEFTINFVETGYNWVGKGKTGNVVDQPISGNAKNRLNW